MRDNLLKAKKKAADKGLILGDRIALKATVDKDTGFLTAPVNLARIGVQRYYGFELGLEDRALDQIGVMRNSDEVFSKSSINSFINLVVTDGHPADMVNADNVKELQMGQVSQVDRDEDVLSGVVTITDKNLIKDIQAGKKEVSVGYKYELIPAEGKDYEFAQINIRANHLAIVDAGRCGSACKINMDSKTKEKTVKITINGIDYDVEDTALAQAIQKLKSGFDAEKEKLEKEKDELEKKNEELEKEKDKAEAGKDAAEKLVLDDDTINKMVSDRAGLLTEAKDILGDKMLECTDCPKEIKAAVIDAVLDMGDLSDKSVEYIDAAYDMALKQHKKAAKSVKKLGEDFQTKDGKTVTRESARKGYMKDQLGLEAE